MDFKLRGSSILLPPVSFPLFHFKAEIRHEGGWMRPSALALAVRVGSTRWGWKQRSAILLDVQVHEIRAGGWKQRSAISVVASSRRILADLEAVALMGLWRLEAALSRLFGLPDVL